MSLDDIDGDIRVVVEGEADNSVRVTPTGTEIDLPDGSVVVQLGAPASEGQPEDEDPKQFYRNLVDKIDDGALSVICEDLIEQIGADDVSRQEMLSIRSRGIGLLGLKLEQPQASGADSGADAGGGMSVVVNPLLAESCLKAWANAQAELLPADGPCKVEDFDPNEPQANQKLADDFERGMNFYLTEIATEYAPDTSHMLLWGTVFGGCGIKKVYISPQLGRPVSESIDVKDFIVSDTTKDLRSCERLTHRLEIRPSIMKRLQMKGFYRDITLAPPTAPEPNAVDNRIAGIQGTSPTPQRRPEDQPYTLYETQCELLLPDFSPKEYAEKQIALPFLVTIEKDSRTVLSIRRDWKPEDEDCKRRQMYVKYPYVPGPGFYGTGLLNILGNSSSALTAAWRLALDAAMYANFPGGLVSEIGQRQKSMEIRPAPGEFAPIQTNGKAIGDIVANLPYKDVTPGLMTLIDKIMASAEKAAGAVEIPLKEGAKDIPVGTMLAYIEQAGQMVAAAHKGMHRAQSEELTLIADLFREDPESFWRGNAKYKNEWTEQRLFLALKVCTLVPRSDPNVPSHIHRIMKATALVQLLGIPQFAPLLNAGNILERVLEVMKVDPTGLINPPPPPNTQPSPEQITAMAKMKDSQTKADKVQVDATKVATDSENRARELAGEERVETLKLAQTSIAHAADNKKAAVDTAHRSAEHGLNVAQAVHDATIDHANLALDTHQALNPPQPAPDEGQGGAS
jgi:hypothetical protein